MKIKHLILAAIATCAFAASDSHAQFVKRYVPIVDGSFTNGFSSATNIAYVINCPDQSSVSVQISVTNAAADAVNANTLFYQRSADGVLYHDVLTPIGITMSATSRTIVTNIPTQGAGYIRFPYFTNACGAGTNNSIVTISHSVNWSAP